MAPAQQRLHPGLQLAHAEGLGEVVVAADLQTDDLVEFGVPRREEQHGHVAFGAQAAAHLVAVDAGEHHVEHDQVERARASPERAPRRRWMPRDVVALLLQVVRDELGDGVFVVDDEDVRRSLCHEGLPRWGECQSVRRRCDLLPLAAAADDSTASDLDFGGVTVPSCAATTWARAAARPRGGTRAARRRRRQHPDRARPVRRRASSSGTGGCRPTPRSPPTSCGSRSRDCSSLDGHKWDDIERASCSPRSCRRLTLA